MLFEAAVFSFGCLLLHSCAPILFEHKPAIKSDALKQSALAFFYVAMIHFWLGILIPIIRSYGSSETGIVSIPQAYYFDIVMVLFWTGLLVRSSYCYLKRIPNSLALIGIPKDSALPVLYKTLASMGLDYQENVRQIKLPGQNLDIGIELADQELRFRVDKAIDKLFLQRLCRAYQAQYQAEKLPLKKVRAILHLLLGAVLMMMPIYWLAVTFIFNYFPDWKGFFPELIIPRGTNL